jgi:hypothetical protein
MISEDARKLIWKASENTLGKGPNIRRKRRKKRFMTL